MTAVTAPASATLSLSAPGAQALPPDVSPVSRALAYPAEPPTLPSGSDPPPACASPPAPARKPRPPAGSAHDVYAALRASQEVTSLANLTRSLSPSTFAPAALRLTIESGSRTFRL